MDPRGSAETSAGTDDALPVGVFDQQTEHINGSRGAGIRNAAAPAFVRKLTLYSVLPQQALLAQLDGGFVAHPSNKEQLRVLWERASRHYSQYGRGDRSFLATDDIQPLEGVDPARLETLLRRVMTYPPYDTHPMGVYSVRISKLITPQLVVNLDRAERRADSRPGMATDELFGLAFEPAGRPEIVVRQLLGMNQNSGAIIFTSYDEDIRLHHPPLFRTIPINDKDDEGAAFESICLPVGGGIPFASAFRIQCASGAHRLILNNGIHRAYRLARAGYERCPLLVTDLIPLELPDPFVDLPKDMLLNPQSNPPLITDFLNDNVVIPLDYYAVLKTIRLNWSFEQYVTVLR